MKFMEMSKEDFEQLSTVRSDPPKSVVRSDPPKSVNGWRCERHGEIAQWLGLNWQWYPADGNHRRGRYVPFDVTVGCYECCEEFQVHIQVSLGYTKGDSVNRVIAQALRHGLLGYLGKTDVSRALREVYKCPI